jgi:hypothetical protein
VGVLAIDRESGRHVTLEIRDGKIDWTAPDSAPPCWAFEGMKPISRMPPGPMAS